MRYEEAIRALFSLESRGIRLGVRRMADALESRGRPDRGMPFIHVAGTNGKGSTATMLAECLRAAGHRVGLFTSPHLHRYVERIRIDGRPIRQAEAARRITDLLSHFGARGGSETTFFELTNLLAVEAFVDHGCDVGVMEVGLGGRLDSTNALDSRLTVVTRIALDHTRFLGDDLASIAREKAGILKPGVPMVCGSREPAARRVIRARARRLGVPQHWIDQDFQVLPGPGSRFAVQLGKRTVENLRLRLPGAHQRDNAACAVAGLLQLRGTPLAVSDADLVRGLWRARWPGRLERVAGRPPFVFDAAHNVDGCRALTAHLSGQRRGAGRRVLVFGAMADKDLAGMLAELGPHFDRVYYPPAAMPRAATPAQLQRILAGKPARSMADALARARRAAGPEGLVVAAGSVFLVAQAREQALGVRSDPFIRM